MKGNNFFLLSLLLCLTIPAHFSCDVRNGPILRTADGAFLSLVDMADDLEGLPLVFIGEIHDVASHHETQLQVIRALHERDRPVAIGLEMFHDGHQEDLDAWVRGELTVEEFSEVYRHNWNHPWFLYRDIFLYARDNAIAMVGLNAPPDITAQVAARGFASLAPDQTARLPGVACNVDREYEAFIRKALSAHAERPKNFRFFCEAQMVWDTTMAWRVLKYLGPRPESTMVVLAGSGHAWKKGVPEQVRRRASLPFRTILPEVEARLEMSAATTEETDYLWTGLQRR
jgi:uncharacterized iron-regulated protein